MTRVLIFDGAPAASQAGLAAYGCPSNTQMFEGALARHVEGLDCFTLNVADGERLPQGVLLADFDGVVITGSPLNVYKDEPAVARQIALAREIFETGTPVWGSCWGLQLMTAALGGDVRRNPNGREVGIARNIQVTEAGRGHSLFAGKADAFAALCSHEDEVSRVPDGAVVLAANAVSAVQAMEVSRGACSFVGVQYHPEHTFATAAAIIDARRERLTAEGLARTPSDFDGVVSDLRALQADGTRRDASWRLGLEADVLDPVLRTLEMRNWIEAKVVPRRAARLAAT